MTPISSHAPVLLYDGECGLCHRAVAFILRHERSPEFLFAPLTGEFATAALADHGLSEAPRDTLVVLESDRLLIRSDAVLAITARLRAPWCWIRVTRPIPQKLRARLYDAVARRRHRWFRRPDAPCPLLTPAERARFRE